MLSKILGFIFGLWCIIILYDVFFSRTPFDSILVAVILLAIIAPWRTTILWTVLLGVFLDASTPLPPSVLLLSLILVSSITLLLIRLFFQHGSLWTTALLAFSGTFFFEFSQTFWQYFLHWTGSTLLSPALPELSFLGWRAVWNTLAALIGFLCIRLLSKRLNPSFLSLNQGEFLWRS
ncbi:MAG: hypothetical protein AAB444_02505 [Patescibacteria group bacterium]